jgi:hypothetical protein
MGMYSCKPLWDWNYGPAKPTLNDPLKGIIKRLVESLKLTKE